MVSEAFGGFKELKLAGLEALYSKRFQSSTFKRARCSTISLTIGIMPRYLLEAIAIGGMIIVILISIVRNDGSFSNILPVLSLYAFAIYRLMPSLQQAYQAASQLRFSAPCLDLVYSEFLEISSYKSPESIANRVKLNNCLEFL